MSINNRHSSFINNINWLIKRNYQNNEKLLYKLWRIKVCNNKLYFTYKIKLVQVLGKHDFK